MKTNLRYYNSISRLIFPKSYIAKIVLVALVAQHGPITFVSFVLPTLGIHTGALPGRVPPQIISPMILLGTILMAFLLWVLLQPVTACSQSLRDYMDRGMLPQLPTQGDDQAGILMSDLQHTLTCLDQLLKEQERRATHDSLTEIGNRAWSDSRLKQDIRRAKDNNVPICLCMIDLDHFKQINDTYGHETGDRVLQQMARILKEGIRGEDWVARWGGDEFVLLFWNCTAANAAKTLNRIWSRVHHETWTLAPDASHNLSASMGFCEYDGVDEVEDLFVKADSALYAAKMRGRDCIVSFDAGLRLISQKLHVA